MKKKREKYHTQSEVWYALLGRLTAYLVMRLVLPTLWSPRSTILVRLGGAEEKSAAAGVEGFDIIQI
jgi:hypothetical protein